MKNFILSLVLAVAMIAPAAVSAQKAEIQIGYGGYTQMDATNMHDSWKHVNNAWGALTLGVNFRVMPKLWIGPSYSLSTTTTKGPHHSNIAYHVIMLNGRYQYYSNSIVKLYAHLGLGVDLSYMQPRDDDNYTKGYFAYQFTPLGAQVDLSRNCAIFGELGFGAQGLLQVGFRFGI